MANLRNVLIGTIENAENATGSKQEKIASYSSYFQSFGCSLEDTDIVPRTFILDNPQDCAQFFRYSIIHPQSAWFHMPSLGQEAYGITVRAIPT